MIKTYTEEHITTSVTQIITKENWEIISAHPPDGHGPFTIPMPTNTGMDIDRSGIHPDIVAIKKSNNIFGYQVLLIESKMYMQSLAEDIIKVELLTTTPSALKYIGFRLQRFKEYDGVDYDAWAEADIKDLPIFFGFAYKKIEPEPLTLPKSINGFNIRKFPIKF